MQTMTNAGIQRVLTSNPRNTLGVVGDLHTKRRGMSMIGGELGGPLEDSLSLSSRLES